MKEVKIGGSLGCSNQAKFMISRNMGLAKSKVGALNFRRVNSQFKELMDEIWDAVLSDRGTDQSWQLNTSLRGQEFSIPMCNKSSREGGKTGMVE